MSSISIDSPRGSFSQEFGPAVYKKGSLEGKAEVIFSFKGITFHNEFITVTRAYTENRAVCTIKGRVRRFSLGATLDYSVGDETVSGSERYDSEQLRKAQKTALAKIMIHEP